MSALRKRCDVVRAKIAASYHGSSGSEYGPRRYIVIAHLDELKSVTSDALDLLDEMAQASESLHTRWLSYSEEWGDSMDAYYKLAKHAQKDWAVLRDVLAKYRGDAEARERQAEIDAGDYESVPRDE